MTQDTRDTVTVSRVLLLHLIEAAEDAARYAHEDFCRNGKHHPAHELLLRVVAEAITEAHAALPGGDHE